MSFLIDKTILDKRRADINLMDSLKKRKDDNKKEKQNIEPQSIIAYLLNINQKSMSRKDLEKRLKVSIPEYNPNAVDSFYQKVETLKLKYNIAQDSFELKSNYEISNIDELKNLIKTSEKGILEKELKFAYIGIDNDIKQIKDEKFVKAFYNIDEECNVLLYRNADDYFEQIITDDKYKEALTFIRDLWKENDNYTCKFENNDGTTYAGRKRQRDNFISFNGGGVNNDMNNNKNVKSNKKQKKK